MSVSSFSWCRQAFCAFLVLIVGSKALGQQSWFWQNPLPQGNTLLAVQLLSPNTYVAIGDAGTILRTTNGGASWQTQVSGVPNLLLGLSFSDANNGTAVGFGGIILRTTDGGITWLQQSSGSTTRLLYGVFFSNQNKGVAVGDSGAIFRTTNGGATWSAQYTGAADLHVGVFFSDTTNGTIVGGAGKIFRTTDGGATWTPRTSGTIQTLIGVYFTDVNTGTAVGNSGTILRTANGGTTWAAQTSGVGVQLWGVSFTDVNTGTATGGGGTILHTINGGATWTAQTSGVTNQLYRCSFFDANLGMAVGISGAALKTTNGGAIWTSLTSGVINVLYSVSFSDVNNGTVVGDNGTILHTTNSGALWAGQGSGTANQLNGVASSDASTWTAVGAAGTVRRTVNGGNTWTAQTSGTVQNLNSVSLTDASTGTIVGAAGVILRTTNGGTTWTAQASGTAVPLWGVAFFDANKGIAVGDAGTIRFTGNGGATWSPGTGGGVNTLNAVAFADANTAIAVGLGGTILKSVNAGATWTAQTSGITAALKGVAFTNANVGTAVGFGGNILRTTNAGTSWTSETSPVTGSFLPSATFNAVAATQFKKRVVVGNGGFILTTGSLQDSAAVATNVAFPAAPTASTDYRLLSIPGVTRSVAVSRLVTGTQNMDWKMFRDNGAATNYLAALTPDSTLTSGEGYWLLRKGSVSFSGNVAIPPLSSGDVYSIPLHAGWNIIANPFDKSVSWSAAGRLNNRIDTVASAQLRSYTGTGGYVNSTTLAPFAGYYFFNDPVFGLGTTLRVPYPFAPPSSAPIIPPGIEWQLQLVFESDINRDAENFVGITPSAKEGLDMMDAHKPPLFLDQGFLYFARPGWDHEYSRFSSDIRPSMGDGQVWDFEVANPRKSEATIKVLGTDQVPQGYRLVLINEQNSIPYDLRQSNTYRYATTGEKMSFKLMVGNDAFVKKEISLMTPASFELAQNYPNPFNPSTSIRYTVSHQAHVQVQIFSILGQLVKTIVNDQLEPGVYTAVWDSRNNSGYTASSGVYFYRMLVDGNPLQTRKMLLMK